MTARAIILAGTAVALLAAGCYSYVRVFQGGVVAVDAAAGTMQVRDERAPHATLTFTGTGAQPGDVVRIAYRETEGGLVIIRLQQVRAEEPEAGGH